jgi:hypothetical protein
VRGARGRGAVLAPVRRRPLTGVAGVRAAAVLQLPVARELRHRRRARRRDGPGRAARSWWRRSSPGGDDECRSTVPTHGASRSP